MAQTQNAGAAVAAGHVGGKVIAGIQIDFGADVQQNWQLINCRRNIKS